MTEIQTPSHTKHRLVVVGGGFGGLEAVYNLRNVDICITIIDQRNHHLFQPLLYQVATSTLATSEIAWPIRHLVRKYKNVKTLLGTVESVDERSTTALWSNDSLARRQLSAPEVFSSYVAVGDFEGYLHLLSQVDGRFVGRERIDSDGLRSRPLVVGNMLYVFGNSGKLEALTIK